MSNTLFDSVPYVTPYDDEYPTSERTTASLLIYSLTVPPGRMTALLGLTPTVQHVMGEQLVRRSPRPAHLPPRQAPYSSHHHWFLHSEHLVPSLDLRRHLDWLLDQLVPASEGLREIRRAEKTVAFVNCKWWMRGIDTGPALWPRQMRLLADLDLELNIGISCYEDDPDDPAEG